jgi:hypothetical protein
LQHANSLTSAPFRFLTDTNLEILEALRARSPARENMTDAGFFRSSSIHLCGCPHNNRTVSAPPLRQGEAWIAH